MSQSKGFLAFVYADVGPEKAPATWSKLRAEADSMI